MGWKEDQAIAAAERKSKKMLRSAEKTAERKIERLTPDAEWELFGDIMGTLAELAPAIDLFPGVPPGSGPALAALLGLASEGTQAIAYEAQGKSELAEKHGLQAAAGGASTVGTAAAAAGKSTGSKGAAAGDADAIGTAAAAGGKSTGTKGAAAGGQGLAVGANVGAGLLAQEAAKAASTPGSLEYETALAYEQKFGDRVRAEQKLFQEAAMKRQRIAQRRAQAFGGDPFGTATAAAAPAADPFAAPPEAQRSYIPTQDLAAGPTTAVGSSPGAGAGGGLPPEAQTSSNQPQYSTKQLALTAEGTSPSTGTQDANMTPKTADSTKEMPWYDIVGQYSTQMGPQTGGIAALGTGIAAAGRTEQAIREGKEEQIPLAWLDWLMANAQRSSGKETYGKPGEASIEGGKAIAAAPGGIGLDPSLIDLFT